jgi:prephenate dehydrogenase
MKPKIISIIGGKGQMGFLFAEAFLNSDCHVLISDLDTDLTNKEVASKGDIVIISVPIRETEKVIQEVAPYLKESAMLTDFTSIKVNPLKIMEKSFNGEIIGGHPLFGPTGGFDNQNFILCPYRQGIYYEWYKNFLKSLGLNIIELTPEEHDKNMAVIQCLIHFSNLALANTLKELNYDLDFAKKLSSPVYLLRIYTMGRILAQDERLYSDIQIDNPYSEEMAKIYQKNVSDLLKDISEKSKIHFEKKFSDSREYFGETCIESLHMTDKLIKELKKNKPNTK